MTLNSHANKMYKYKEEENCKIHSLAGMGCWNISKVLQKCELFNYRLYLLGGVKFAMLVSDTEKQESTGTVYSMGMFDSKDDVGCANLLRQVSFKFYYTLKKQNKNNNLGDLTRQ